MQTFRVQLPYGSWSAVCSFLDHLSGGAIPARIDESVFNPHQNEATIEQVFQSLRRLGLIGKGGTPSPALRRILLGEGEGWRETLQVTYKEFFKAGWETMTAKQFLTLLDSHGAKGETARRAGRFVLHALRDTGIGYSGLLDGFASGDRRPKPPGRETAVRRDAEPSPKDSLGGVVYRMALDSGECHAHLRDDRTDRDVEYMQGLYELERQWKRRGTGNLQRKV